MGAALLLCLLAQIPQAPPPPADPPAEGARPAEAPPAKPVIENTGKPIRIPFDCSEQDISTFGMTCTSVDPCPVFVQVTHVEAVGAKLFLTGNFHNGATTMYSLLLASEDEGKTWMEPHERIKSAGLELTRFFDFQNGWVSGQTLMAFPRDPFLLITTDGGKTWRRYDVFPEGKVGSIEQLWFDSRTQGGLIIDRTMSGESGARWEHYESMTGGESWSLREISSKPLRLKTPAPAAPAWRVRADGVSKSHRLERMQAGRWQPVASFLVQVGSCKPDDVPIPEPVTAPAPEPEKPAAPKPPASKKAPTMKKKQP
ncbi:MAG: sialidase family protein [Bryobacteraceae bacterium]